MYYVYAFVILITSILSIGWEIHLAKTNEKSLKELLSTSDTTRVTVIRDSEAHRISPRHLVIGDAIILEDVQIPAVADMVLIQGGAVIDESSLTGESVPVVKVPLGLFDRRGEMFEPSKCKSSVIYGGSKIVELKPGPYVAGKRRGGDEGSNVLDGNLVVGIVTATGFHSVKGELFRSILFPTKIVSIS
jgi:cation-transporting ATPase 13A3/4/5